MILLIVFLTFLLVVNCLLLMLLVLIQLPKKEAGAGIAFGGGATDALFGSGSGNALTKMTKYSAAVFVGMSLLLSLLNANRAKDKNHLLEMELLKKANATSPAQPLPTAANPLQATALLAEATNALKTTLTNQAAQLPPAATPAANNSTAAPVVIKQVTTNPAPAAATTLPPATNPAAAPAPKK